MKMREILDQLKAMEKELDNLRTFRDSIFLLAEMMDEEGPIAAVNFTSHDILTYLTDAMEDADLHDEFKHNYTHDIPLEHYTTLSMETNEREVSVE